MSTRYIYDIYNTTVANRQSISRFTANVTEDYNWSTATKCNSYKESVAYDRSGTPITLYTPTDNPDDTDISNIWMSCDYSYGGTSYDSPVDTSEYKYIIYKKYIQGNRDVVGECYLLEFIPGISGAFWHGKCPTHEMSIWNNDSSGSNNGQNLKSFFKSGGPISKGASILGTESSKSRLTEGAFSQSGIWKWRIYKGSDTIDPTAVTYSKTDLYPGEPVIISVAPITPTYGGIISYLYQYSTNGGSTWTNIGSKTTETTASVTIPEGAKQFQSRVTASDGWGFTSTTPVFGPNLEVSQLKAYASVNGVNRTGTKLFATMDGKIREIQKGYAMIGGKVRKLF